MFSADASGIGLAAAVALRVGNSGLQVFEPIARYDQASNKYLAVPIDLEAGNAEAVFLILFGTGIRERNALDKAEVRVGTTLVPVTFAGAQGDLAGLDQINIELPRSLKGGGEMPIQCVVDGKVANHVTVVIK